MKLKAKCFENSQKRTAWKYRGIAALLLVMVLPAFAPGQRFSLNDQGQQFNDYINSSYRWASLTMGPLEIRNQGKYPIISVKMDGQEQLPQNHHIPVGSSITASVSSLFGHTVQVAYGTPDRNLYGAPFEPIWYKTYWNVHANTRLTTQDWSAADALVNLTWYGFYLVHGAYVDSTFVFRRDGTFEWVTTSGTNVRGVYWGGQVNTYGVYREIHVMTTTGEMDTLILLEHERILNVEIVDSGDGIPKTVTHRPF